MAAGQYIADYGWSDSTGYAIVDFGFSEPAIIPPTPVGDVVAGGFVYKADDGRLYGRFRCELLNGITSSKPLSPDNCSLDLIAEDGTTTSIVGIADPVDEHFVYFAAIVPLEFPKNYIARVTLKTVAMDIIGPRTFPLPVS